MGLVMQEPTLFNYTIKENILYGDSDAKDSDIREAARVANSLEFIESDELYGSYEDSASVLLNAYIQAKIVITAKIGETEYDSKIKSLEHLTKKEELEGKFQAVKGEMDDRSDERRDLALNAGFEIECGVKGGKLSGGQK